MLRGLGEIKKNQDRTQELMSKDRINYIFLKDRESAIIRFLTDGDEVILANFHTVEEVTPKGKRFSKHYCTQDLTCKYCAQGVSYGEVIFLWGYCKYILHRTQNPRIDDDPNAPKWPRVRSGDQVYYKEDVNGPRIFSTGPGKGGAYKNALIKYSATYKTLLDRDYIWERQGTGLGTTYTLTPKDPSKIEDSVKELIGTLPPLEKVVKGEIISLSGDTAKVADDEVEELDVEVSSTDNDGFEVIEETDEELEEEDIAELF